MYNVHIYINNTALATLLGHVKVLRLLNDSCLYCYLPIINLYYSSQISLSQQINCQLLVFKKGLRTIQAKTITSDASRSSSVRKPFGSVNSHDTKKSSSGEGKSLKESIESLKGKVVDGPTDVKPTGGARKKTGLVARPVVQNQNKEHEGKKLLEPKVQNVYEY